MPDQPPLNLPDLSGVSLYLCTPSSDGKYVREYVRSLDATKEAVRAAGGKIDWGEIPYCADLSFARNMLFGAFLRSGFTHMLMVDADMGWDAYDPIRLIESGLEFVGGAGPRKKYPPQFCMDFTDEKGELLDSEYVEASRSMEVTGIGTGFLMIRRSVAEKMVEAYPDLVFEAEPGNVKTTEYGLFDPIITNKRRRSDDYAFCYRWRAIGGTIHMMPAIKLKHSGTHIFEGSVLESLVLSEPGLLR